MGSVVNSARREKTGERFSTRIGLRPWLSLVLGVDDGSSVVDNRREELLNGETKAGRSGEVGSERLREEKLVCEGGEFDLNVPNRSTNDDYHKSHQHFPSSRLGLGKENERLTLCCVARTGVMSATSLCV